MKNFLVKLLEIDSPAGMCEKACEFVKDEFTKLGYEVTSDNKGNLGIYIDAKQDKTVGIASHIDTLGFVVRSVNSNGTLRVVKLGGPIMSSVNGEYCNIHTRDGKVYRGTILNKDYSVHVYKNSQEKILDSDLIVRIDADVSTKDDVLKLGINNGDFVCYDPKVEIVGDYIKSRFLDDKACVAITYEFLKNLDKSKLNSNLYIMFSTYEEVGFGAGYLQYNVNELIALDMGCIGDDLSGDEKLVSICAKDGGGPYDYNLTTKLINIAKENEIGYAVDVYHYYSSDATASLRAGNNIRAALIGPGIHASHGMERAHFEGINNTIKLLNKYLLNN